MSLLLNRRLIMATEDFCIKSEINQKEVKRVSSDIKQEEDDLENQRIELQNDHQANDWDEICTKINSQSSTADNGSKQSKEVVCTLCMFKAYRKNHLVLHIKNGHSDIRQVLHLLSSNYNKEFTK